MAELKTCPFCGGEASIKREHDSFTDTYEGYIECVQCGSRTKSVDITMDSRDTIARPNPIRYVVELWNARETEVING